ncbi:trigger factor [Actinomyces sp. oral taxon 181]|uniref:trigger factor n=1 Tax=Actinomyces sp. oral taxon 181 TaxID=712121 RepID=UPI0002A39512|nr:trigger factor [Actinomyces sp. oral taxon 181]EKY14883.1 trigger factor [Actinomyces sp. oral taxon 181 str. F0379]
MKSTVETLEPTKVRLTVEIPVEELKSEMDKAYKSIANQVSIPGFRKGHVPARIIDQRFGRAAVIEQVVNEVLPGQYSAAVSENELRPMSQPEVEVTEIPSTTGELTGQLVFTAQVDVVPAFDIPEYGKDTVIEVDPVEVTDEDVQEELDALRGRFASLKTIKRQAKTGDFATIDLVATINGEEVDSVSDVSYEIGSGTMLDGQDTALRKTHAGDVVTFTSTLKGGEHEGEEAEVTLTVKSVKERELPEADDDFAQMVSEFDTIDDLKEDLKKQAAQTKQSQQALQARDRLVENLLSRTEILLPESVIEHELSHRVAEDASAKAKKEAREAIEKEYRTEILAEELAKKNEVQVGQQELFDYAIQMSQTYGMDINRLFSDPQQISAVVADLGRAKALIEVLSEVTVKDTAGNDVDLSEFLGKSDEEAAAEAAAETVAEVEEAAAEIADEK